MEREDIVFLAVLTAWILATAYAVAKYVSDTTSLLVGISLGGIISFFLFIIAGAYAAYKDAYSDDWD